MVGAERDSLRGWLDYHRATLAWKCDHLGDEELRQQSVSPSKLSLLGLVRHMAEVERHWFQRIIAGEPISHVWSDDGDFQAAYDATGATRAEAFGAWQDQITQSRAIEARVDSLDSTFWVESWESEASLRTLVMHLIHDYARHNGHADLLREAIDDVTGT